MQIEGGLLKEGNILLRQGKYAEAIKIYEKILVNGSALRRLAEVNIEIARKRIYAKSKFCDEIGTQRYLSPANQSRSKFLLEHLLGWQRGRSTYINKDFDSIVESAISRSFSRKNVTKEYELVREYFDFAFYIASQRDMAQAKKLDLVQHYLDYGGKQGRDPSPYFNARFYLEKYPQVRESGVNPYYHWLSEGRSKGWIAEPFQRFSDVCGSLGIQEDEASTYLAAYKSDLRKRFLYGELGRQVEKAAQLDPLVTHSWNEALQVKVPPFHSNGAVNKLAVIQKLCAAVEYERAEYVIVINRPRWGGGLKDEGYLARALRKKCKVRGIVVLFTDEDGVLPEGRFEAGTRIVNFARFSLGLDHEAKQQLLSEFLRALGPKAVFNVNSRLLWDVAQVYGKALAHSMDLYAYIFCNEKTIYGYWTGYPAKFFYRCFDVYKGVFVDSHYLKKDLIEKYSLGGDYWAKVTVLEAPVDTQVTTINYEQRGRKKVFWAGRFDKQKRLDILYGIADRMPEVEFHVWGKPLLEEAGVDLSLLKNVVLHGAYENFSSLPLNECAVWLYTSEWDGVPHLLLEVCMTGIPIVGSMVGGTDEILHSDLSWPIQNYESIESYVDAIRLILSDEPKARSKAVLLRERLESERTLKRYSKSVLGAIK